MKTTINLGKIDYDKNGIKINNVCVDLSLEQKNCVNYKTLKNELMYIFSASGIIFNSRNSDAVCCGQCLDEINNYIKNPLMNEIFSIWKEFHLNDLKPGTKKQLIEVEKFRKENNITGFAYKKECDYLKSVNLLIDRGIKWGSVWFCMEIPENIVNRIKEIIINHK